MAARLLPALALTLAIGMLAASGIRADGDPASDVLLVRNVFYTYAPPPAPRLQAALNAEDAAAAAAGYRVKVALVRSPLDLGLVPELYGKPQQYADFLGQEISLQYKGPLLVVMPAGYGVHRVTSAARAAVTALPKPSGADIDDLARSALGAMAKMATASGHPIAVPAQAGGSAGGSSAPLIAAGVGVAVVTLTLFLVIRRQRAARREGT